MIGKITEKKLKSGLLIGITGILLLIFLTNLFHYNYHMNADIASETILGEVIWKSRQLIPDTWYPSTEVRIISVPNMAALFFGMTEDMVLSAGMACCMMTVLILLSILCFSKLAGMKKMSGLLMAFLCLAIPSGFIMLELLYLFAGYYAIHVVVCFFTLGIYALFIKKRKIAYKLSGGGILSAFLLGLQGVRGILVIYGPLLGVEIIRNIYFIYQKKKRSVSDFCISLWTLSLFAVSYLGTLFPFSVGQEISRNMRKGVSKLFTAVIPDMARAIGFESANLLGKICLGILLLSTVYMLGHILHLMWKREMESRHWAWLVMCASPLLTALIVAFTTVDSTERYYFMLLFLLPFSAAMVWEKGGSVVKYMVGVTAILFAVSNIAQMYLPVFQSEEPPLTEEYEVTAFLEEKGLSTAYATFENANTMTVLANGSVRVYPVASMEKMDICKWLASTDWYCPNVPFKQKTAYIVTDAEKDSFAAFLEDKDVILDEAGRIGRYTIYVSDYNYSNMGED